MKTLIVAACLLFFLDENSVTVAQEFEKPGQAKTDTGYKQMSEAEKVSHLINYVRNLDPKTVFIRNDEEFNPGKAADHLQSKYEKHKKRVKTAHDFVDGLAAKSRTGDPYLIRFPDGRTVKCKDLLNEELNKIEQAGS